MVNLLNDSDNESSEFAIKKRYAIHNQNGTDYDESTSANFETEDIK